MLTYRSNADGSRDYFYEGELVFHYERDKHPPTIPEQLLVIKVLRERVTGSLALAKSIWDSRREEAYPIEAAIAFAVRRMIPNLPINPEDLEALRASATAAIVAEWRARQC